MKFTRGLLVAFSTILFVCCLSLQETQLFGVQDDQSILDVALGPESNDICGYVEFDEASGFFAYDIASDTVVVGEIDFETGMMLGSTESLAGDILGYFAFDTVTGDLFHYDTESGDISDHNVLDSAGDVSQFAIIVPIVRAAIPIIIKGGKAAAPVIVKGGKWVGGKIKGGGKWVKDKIWPPKVKTAKELAEEQYIKKLIEKGAKNKSVEKVDETDFRQ